MSPHAAWMHGSSSLTLKPSMRTAATTAAHVLGMSTVVGWRSGHIRCRQAMTYERHARQLDRRIAARNHPGGAAFLPGPPENRSP